jgi:hypothetical protein
MNFFQRLITLLTGKASPDSVRYIYYVQAHGCPTIQEASVHLYNDLSVEYEDGKQTYLCRKIVSVDGKTENGMPCFRSVEIELMFNRNRQLVDRDILGGRFATEEEYLAQSN